MESIGTGFGPVSGNGSIGHCGSCFAKPPTRNPVRRLPSSPGSPCERRREESGGGYDGGKKITGRKRHVAVDTLGLIVAVTVHGAYWQDHDGVCFLLMKLRRICPRLKALFADSAYGRNGLPQWVREKFGWVLQTVLRPVGVKGFEVLPKRWVV